MNKLIFVFATFVLLSSLAFGEGKVVELSVPDGQPMTFKPDHVDHQLLFIIWRTPDADKLPTEKEWRDCKTFGSQVKFTVSFASYDKAILYLRQYDVDTKTWDDRIPDKVVITNSDVEIIEFL